MSTQRPQYAHLSTGSRETLTFEAIALNRYGFETALGALVRLGNDVRLRDRDLGYICGPFDNVEAIVRTPRGKLTLSVYEVEVWENEEVPGRDHPSYKMEVTVRVGTTTISEESFLKMVGA